MNPSLSLTLREAVSNTRMQFDYDPSRSTPELRFRFEGKESTAFEWRIRSFVERLFPYLPMLKHTALDIESENTFPHSSGIASSASAMSALALCLLHMEQQSKGITDNENLLMKASFMARLGSGSASRSVYPGFALWGADKNWEGSSDEYAIPVGSFHREFNGMKDAILVVESGQKRVSSSAGHSLMDTNPFSDTRFLQARENLESLGRVLQTGDWEHFIDIMEEEALTLHAMMMTGRPGYLLMQPATLSIIQRTREFRKQTGCRIGFTLDAGANVHLLYADTDATKAEDFIQDFLTPYCEDSRVIHDRMGDGPVAWNGPNESGGT